MWVSGQRAAAEPPAALARVGVFTEVCVRRGGVPRVRRRRDGRTDGASAARAGAARASAPTAAAATRSGALERRGMRGACDSRFGPSRDTPLQVVVRPRKSARGGDRRLGGTFGEGQGLQVPPPAPRRRPPPFAVRPGQVQRQVRPRSSITTLRGRHLQEGGGGERKGGPRGHMQRTDSRQAREIPGKKRGRHFPLQKSKGLLRPSMAWRESLQLARGAGAPAPRGSSRRPPWALSPWARPPSRPRRPR